MMKEKAAHKEQIPVASRPTTDKIVVVIPTYNEASNLPELSEHLFSLGIDGLNVLLVDDNSPDGTADLAESLSQRYGGRIKILRRPGKMGLGTAYVAGFAKALEEGAQYVIEMDADLSHSPHYIPQLLEKVRDYDVVVGSRYVKGGGVDKKWSRLRRLVSRGGSIYSSLILGLKVKDTTTGFKCFRREALAGLDLSKCRSRGFGFQVEVAYACQKKRYRVAEVPIIFIDRTQGKSKMSMKIFMEAMWRVWAIRFRR